MATNTQAIEFLKSIGWYTTRFINLKGLELNDSAEELGEMIFEMDALTFIKDHMEEKEMWSHPIYDGYPLDFEDGDDIERALELFEEKWEEHCKTMGWDTELTDVTDSLGRPK